MRGEIKMAIFHKTLQYHEDTTEKRDISQEDIEFLKKMQLHIADHALDQALLQWKYEYLMKQEQWLVELMCGKIEEEEKQEEKQ